MQHVHRTRQQCEDAIWREAFGIIARCIVAALAAAALVTWGTSTEPPAPMTLSAATHAR
jgi:hypothetical protein